MSGTLVLGWSPSKDLSNLFMLSIRALEQFIGSPKVPDYLISIDPACRYAFILCPNDVAAESLRARFVSVGMVKSNQKLTFHDNVNRHPRVCMWI